MAAPQSALTSMIDAPVSAELLAAVVDALPMGIALVDTSAEFRFVHANPTFEGWVPPEHLPLRGRPFVVFNASERDRILGILREVAVAGVPRHFRNFEVAAAREQVAASLPGGIRLWSWDLFPIQDGQGRVSHLLSVGHETTEQELARRAQEEAEARLELVRRTEAAELRGLGERLQELERVKSRFLNLAAHELRGPVTVLQGYLSMMDEGSLPAVSGRAREALPILRARAAHINRLIDDMLDAARLEEGRLELEPETIDLGTAAMVVVQTVGPLATPLHRLRLTEPEQPVLVRGDRNRVHTILADLVENAIKYSPEGGEIHCSVAVEDGLAKVAVHDQGLGIPEEEMPRLFTRFGRTVSRETSHIPGTGLGLYLARELARLHQGDVSVVSTPGRGSIFTLSLPLLDAQLKVPSPELVRDAPADAAPPG